MGKLNISLQMHFTDLDLELYGKKYEEKSEMGSNI